MSVNNTYKQLLNKILSHGTHCEPRGLKCLELICETTIIDMEYPYVSIPDRKIGNRFRAAEAAWIISGDNRVETILPYAKKIGEYSDDGKYFAGAYGPPFRDQLPYVLKCLTTDNSSRQAVVSIWRPRPYNSKDIPCTVSLQFLIRHNRLSCVATMRSSDAWLGWPYDVHNFSCISAYIALHFDNIGLGHLYLTAGSQHLYEENIKKAKHIITNAHKYTDLKLQWKGKTPDEFRRSLWNKADSR